MKYTLLLLLCLQSVFSQDLSSLSKEEIARLNSGELIHKTQEIEGAAWPKSMIYSIVETTPIEAAAIFSDVESQVGYIPDLKAAKIINRPFPHVLQVKFHMHVPWPFKDTFYVNNIHHFKRDNGQYEVIWFQQSSSATDSTEGGVIFRPYLGRTLMSYENFVIPRSKLAGMVKGKAIAATKAAIEQTIKHIHKVKKQPQQLMRNVSVFTRLISGTN